MKWFKGLFRRDLYSKAAAVYEKATKKKGLDDFDQILDRVMNAVYHFLSD
jgi:hypothetical protein